MELKQFDPQTSLSLTLPMQEVRLMPISDIQYGAAGCDMDRLKRHIQWGVEQGAYFIGGGDYLDIMSPSNRRKWAQANLYDVVHEAMNDYIGQKEKELERILAPTRGRWFGLIRGHHWYDFEDGSTSVSRLATFLGCPELGDCAFVTLNLKDERGRNCPVKIWTHHGKGGGHTPGAPLNTLMQIAARFYAHIYLMAHTHTKPVVPIPFIDHGFTKFGKPYFHSVNRYLVSTGGWLKGFEEGTKDLAGHPAGSYIEAGMLAPVTLGGPLIRIRPRFRNGRAAPDISVEV